MQHRFSLRSKSKILDLSSPVVMGILNATPDSFFEGSRMQSVQQAVDEAGIMLSQGAKIVDVGGYSTRPNATKVSESEEMERVLPIIEALTKAHPNAWLSVDTFRSKVADACLNAGASMINDVSAAAFDAALVEVAAKHQVPYVLMHMQGSPETMQHDPSYENVVLDLLQFFDKHLTRLRLAGLSDVIIDVGFGFGKTLDHNYKLLAQLQDFNQLGCPILVGVSRKSMIYKVLKTNAENALNGTTALHMLALEKGAHILRAHDVNEAAECIYLFQLTENQNA